VKNQTSFKIYTDHYIEEAIAFIREHEPPDGYFVGVSFGKDSICAYELVKISGVKHFPFFNCTQIDPPEIYRFGRQYYPDMKWLYPKYSYWEGIKKKGVPFRNARWCCDLLKENPSKNIPLKSRIMGIRAEESANRKKRGRINKRDDITIYSPIFNWLEWQVWEFIEKYSLPYPSLYDEGWGRVGCIICPWINGTNQVKRNMERWPNTYRVFEKVVKDWWLPQTYKHFQTYEQFLNFWYGFKRF